MQVSHVREVYPRIQRSIAEAQQQCQISDDVPDALRDCIAELDSQSGRTVAAMGEQVPNDNKIVECIARLEKLADRAMREVRQAGGIADRAEQAVRNAHDEISALKKRLH